jgi:hypothetical protein
VVYSHDQAAKNLAAKDDIIAPQNGASQGIENIAHNLTVETNLIAPQNGASQGIENVAQNLAAETDIIAPQNGASQGIENVAQNLAVAADLTAAQNVASQAAKNVLQSFTAPENAQHSSQNHVDRALGMEEFTRIGMVLLSQNLEVDPGMLDYGLRKVSIVKHTNGVRLWAKNFAPFGQLEGIPVPDSWCDFFTFFCLIPPSLNRPNPYFSLVPGS